MDLVQRHFVNGDFFTPEGLPVGVQIVGRHQGELRLLQLAFAFEQLTQVGKIRPPLSP